MNKQRRAAIAAIRSEVDRLGEQVEALRGRIEDLRDEEQDYYDNMPESLQGAERGEAAEQAIAHLGDAVDALEEFDPESIAEALDSAAQ